MVAFLSFTSISGDINKLEKGDKYSDEGISLAQSTSYKPTTNIQYGAMKLLGGMTELLAGIKWFQLTPASIWDF